MTENFAFTNPKYAGSAVNNTNSATSGSSSNVAAAPPTTVQGLIDMVDDTNKRWADPSNPRAHVVLRFGQVETVDRLALCKAADCLIDTSVKDGLNLMPFDFYTCHNQDRKGCVIVSEFFGLLSSIGWRTLCESMEFGRGRENHLRSHQHVSRGKRRPLPQGLRVCIGAVSLAVGGGFPLRFETGQKKRGHGLRRVRIRRRIFGITRWIKASGDWNRRTSARLTEPLRIACFSLTTKAH